MNFTMNISHAISPCTAASPIIDRHTKNLGIKSGMQMLRPSSEESLLVVNRQAAPVVHFATVF